MPTAKGKGGSTSHRYRPASEFDDATLAQKREYWRTKKREQRARLSEQRGKHQRRGERSVHPDCSAAFTSQSHDELSNSGNTDEDGSVRAAEGHKEKWLQTMELNKVSPQVPASFSISARVSGRNTGTGKHPTVRAAGMLPKAVTSPTVGGPQLNIRSSVPPPRASRVTNGSSVKTPQPCVSMQGAHLPNTQPKAQVESHIQPKLTPANMTTGRTFATSLSAEGKTANFTPQRGAKSALVSSQRTKGVRDPHLSSSESEEERAAKRRELWRIKKREQRAKVAARIAKARERIQGTEGALQRDTAQKPGPVEGTVLQHVQNWTCARRVSQNQSHNWVNSSLTSARKEGDKPQGREVSSVQANLQTDQVKILHQAISPVRKSGDSQRKNQTFVHLSSVSRGTTRCKTPRQRFIEAQKTFMIQRNMRCKSPMLATFISSRNIPRIDPNDTPEQIIAKRREYWRVKKREQRAKLSMETKARLKERDLLLRRVKRYQKILEEMRRARAQGAGSTLNHDLGTIGGFIKEDGTVTVNIPANQSAAGALKQEEELTAVSEISPVSQRQNQTDTKLRVSAPVRVNPPQVKVSVPAVGLNKTRRLISIRPRTESTNAPSSTQTVCQLKLTHPETSKGASVGGSPDGAALGGCVMKMAVSSSVAPLSALDPELTEEERMAKKREYWRIKKREQRAARAARLKQGLLQARARKIQRQATTVPPNRSVMKNTENAQSREPEACGIKQEAEADLNPQPEEAICPDIKPPCSPSPPPAPQQDPDPSLSADSQATTLLAVASMKKLLEESLSSVTESKNTQASVKTEDESAEQDMKPNLMQLFLEKDEVSPLAADLTLEIKSWQPDSETSVQAGSSSPHLKNSPPTSYTPPPDPAPNATIENSSQTLSNFILNPSTDTFDSSSSPHAKREVCSPEPPKLHHLPLEEPEPEQKPSLTQVQSINGASAQRGRSAGSEHGGLSSLQRKREYWKMMKRQQRARVKARQRDRAGEASCRHPQRNYQAPGLVINPVKGLNPPLKPNPQPRPSRASLTAVTSIPTVLVVSPAVSHPECSPDTLQVKLPVNRVPSVEQKHLRPSETGSDSSRAAESQKPAASGSGSWVLRSTVVDSPPSLQTLKPPENPLTSINLHPIEPPPQNPTLSPIRVPCASIQTPTHTNHSPTKLAPLSTMVPPKPIPGESEEDFLKRKREYWRVKKKEQRARKAIREKGAMPRRPPNSWRPILPAQELHTQDSGQWVDSEESEHLMSHHPDTDPSSFEFPNYAAPIEDESELLFLDYENLNGEDGPVSDAMWRSRYLMDYDPLNQLLVCMVCGEQQYSHSLEGVRAHIDEAHPDTLNLDPAEHQRILEAWDEQVSQRERFFTSQLQRNSEEVTEAHRD